MKPAVFVLIILCNIDFSVASVCSNDLKSFTCSCGCCGLTYNEYCCSCSSSSSSSDWGAGGIAGTVVGIISFIIFWVCIYRCCCRRGRDTVVVATPNQGPSVTVVNSNSMQNLNTIAATMPPPVYPAYPPQQYGPPGYPPQYSNYPSQYPYGHQQPKQ